MLIKHYIDVIEDLSRELPAEKRFSRLLDAIRAAIPCDAIVLLKLNGDQLVPLTFQGLAPATSGRRFILDQHPRLYQILSSHQAVRFDSNSQLPDPYDGLVQSPDHQLHVHDCMGISIYINQKPWGVITLDALTPGQFDHVEPAQMQAAISLTRAVITANERIYQLQQQVAHGDQVTEELNKERSEQSIIGSSPAIKALLEEVDSVAATPLSVLLQGETGVGKEIIAHHIHLHSERANKPLVQINCAALPETLAESELFGHTKGSFTGATENRSGRFELADGGTLFLDEIGEIPLPLQAKLLRALQEGEIQRMGSDETLKVDVRIIAATNRYLKEEVAAKRFRADLYHRLSVFPILIPPLRDRQNDVLALAEHFLELNQHRLNIRKLILTENAQKILVSYSWPGNVRELEHLLSRAALKASNNQDKQGIIKIRAEHLGLDIDQPATSNTLATVSEPYETGVSLTLKSATELFQRQQVEAVLKENNGNVAATARLLDIDRSNLWRLMKRLGLR